MKAQAEIEIYTIFGQKNTVFDIVVNNREYSNVRLISVSRLKGLLSNALLLEKISRVIMGIVCKKEKFLYQRID